MSQPSFGEEIKAASKAATLLAAQVRRDLDETGMHSSDGVDAAVGAITAALIASAAAGRLRQVRENIEF